MHIETMFFDLDDTVYPSNSGIWEAIGSRMEFYMAERLSIPVHSVKTERERLFRTHGTTMRGLVFEYGIDELDFLNYVHDIPIHMYLSENQRLRENLIRYPQRKVIFTNANCGHAERVLSVLGIRDLFDQIIDILMIKPFCKPQSEAFEIAIQSAGIVNPGRCVMIDDAKRNLLTAHEHGFYTIQVGTNIAENPIDTAILTLEELSTALPVDAILEDQIG